MINSLKSRKISQSLLIISLIWPFAGFIKAIKNYNHPLAKKVILFFFGVYGFCFVLDEQLDGDRYAERLKFAYGRPFSDFNEYIFGLYETKTDFVQPLITFLLSRFTDSHHFLFAIYALLFGYFCLKSIDFVLEKYTLRRNYVAIFFLVFLLGHIPIFDINGSRMWTAAWVFIYATLNVVWNKDYKFLLLAFSACFIHFSFLAANIIVLIWLLAGNRKWIYFVLAVFTLTISEIDLGIIRDYAELINPAFDKKAQAYASETYAEQIAERRQTQAWFMKANPILKTYLLFFNITWMLLLNLGKIKLDKSELNLLNFTLLFFSYANIISLVPSGGRFLSVYYIFASILSIIFFSKYKFLKFNSAYTFVSLAIVSFSTLIMLRVAAPTIHTLVFSPSIFIALGFDTEWSLYSLIF